LSGLAEEITKVKGFNRTVNMRLLVCIVATLLFTIWFALLLQYYLLINRVVRAEGAKK
jgi:hypothetical protein